MLYPALQIQQCPICLKKSKFKTKERPNYNNPTWMLNDTKMSIDDKEKARGRQL